MPDARSSQADRLVEIGRCMHSLTGSLNAILDALPDDHPQAADLAGILDGGLPPVVELVMEAIAEAGADLPVDRSAKSMARGYQTIVLLRREAAGETVDWREDPIEFMCRRQVSALREDGHDDLADQLQDVVDRIAPQGQQQCPACVERGQPPEAFEAYDDHAAYADGSLTRAQAITLGREAHWALAEEYTRRELRAVRVYMRPVVGEEADEVFGGDYESGWVEVPIAGLNEAQRSNLTPMWRIEPRPPAQGQEGEQA